MGNSDKIIMGNSAKTIMGNSVPFGRGPFMNAGGRCMLNGVKLLSVKFSTVQSAICLVCTAPSR